ncbi:MAG: hypothetical protein PCFJNLEI_01125 [Verrucomicrobiae bacterium]|nr:hypothetical protein [Verrucomicrobiae bacterium]
MFKLTIEEQKVVAFLVSILLLGTAVKYWRATHQPNSAERVETRGPRN